MLILDTNVISEEMRISPDPRVHSWLQQQVPANVFTTSISEAELLYGIAALDDGHRKDDLSSAARRILSIFSGRILPFDSAAAAVMPIILVDRRRLGRPIAHHDAQIAAIARSRAMTLATRDTADFTDCGVPLINPWTTF
jgi:predicted nucleic acid-binding protein